MRAARLATSSRAAVLFFDFKDPDGNALSVCWFQE